MMKTQIRYIASSGNAYDLTMQGILHENATYYNWEWKAEGAKRQYGKRVSSFSREPAQYEAVLLFRGDPADMRRTIQAIHADFENDMRRNTPGRIVWGDWYIECYIVSSAVEQVSFWSWIRNTIQVYAPYPFWIKEEKITLSASESESESTFLDYPYDYPYDYSAPVMGERLIYSESPFTSEFKLVIYGEAVNPRIVVNGYAYVLYTTIPAGSYVIIDSKNKTIMMYGTNGAQTNIFDFRNKSASIFEKLPAGNLDITWDATFGADLTIYREQAEPEFEEIK